MEFEYGRLQVRFQSQLEGVEWDEIFPGFQRVKGRWQCRRCGNDQSSRMAMGACQRCGGECLYCLDCLQMGKVKQCSRLLACEEKTPAFESCSVEINYRGKLSVEQEKISQELACLTEKKDSSEHLVWAVTGAGKTEMIFEAIRCVLERGGRVGIAAPRIDVCQELGPRLQAAFPTVDQIVLHGLMHIPYKRVPLTIATTHQLLRFYRAFDLLIVDEVDAFPYQHSKMLHTAVHQSVKQCGLCVYMTATPSRDELIKLRSNKLSYSLLPARYHRHPLIVPSFSWIGDWHQALTRGKLPTSLEKWIESHLEKKIPFLLFVATIDEIPKVERLLRKKFQEARFFSVSSQEADRSQRVEMMRLGQLDFLITTTILERGVTFEGIDVAVVRSHEKLFTREVLVQIAGRVGRSIHHPYGKVVFFHEGITKAMKASVQEIREMNAIASSRGLLEG